MRKNSLIDAALDATSDFGGPGPLQQVRGLQKLQKVQQLPGTSNKVHTGPIHSAVAGRTDHLPVHVPSGSYVIPADVISGMGEGNTNAGFKILKRVFSGLPYGGGSKGPFGSKKVGPYNSGSAPYNPSKGIYDSDVGMRAAGGKTGEDVKVVVAGGEYTLTPEEVLKAGDGDMDRGHRVLDDFVKQMRGHIIKTMSKLPGPRHD